MVDPITFKTAQDAQLNDAGKAERTRLARTGNALKITGIALVVIGALCFITPNIIMGLSISHILPHLSIVGISLLVVTLALHQPACLGGAGIINASIEKALDKEVPSNMIQGQVNV